MFSKLKLWLAKRWLAQAQPKLATKTLPEPDPNDKLARAKILKKILDIKRGQFAGAMEASPHLSTESKNVLRLPVLESEAELLAECQKHNVSPEQIP